MYASENAALIREKAGHQLLVALVGDSLLEVRGNFKTLSKKKLKTLCGCLSPTKAIKLGLGL